MAIPLKQDRALIILIDDIVFDIKPLFLHEVPHPRDKAHTIIDSDQFSFGGAFSIDLLMSGRKNNGSLAHQHH
jgi:hypothetical protein